MDVEFTPTSKAQRDALADGRVQIAQAAVDNAVAMVEGAKKDVIIVSGGSNGMLSLFVRPEVKSYDDIRGKAVVVDAPDTAYALVLYKMLALKGVKRSEYDIFQGGDCMRRLNGIRSDPKNAAVLLNFPCTVLAEREGFPNWGSAAEALGAYQADGAFVMRDWAQQHRETLVNYLAVDRRGAALGVSARKTGQRLQRSSRNISRWRRMSRKKASKARSVRMAGSTRMRASIWRASEICFSSAPR